MKFAQRFLTMVELFINMGERFATEYAPSGEAFTFQYDPDTGLFEVVKDSAVIFVYNTNNGHFESKADEEDRVAMQDAAAYLLIDMIDFQTKQSFQEWVETKLSKNIQPL